MTREIRLRPEAEEDLSDAAAWYELQRAGLGQDFLDQVLVTLASISERPSMFPMVHRGVRRALLHRFPFGVYYQVEPDAIVIVAVLHGSRHPRRWKKRV